MKTVPAGIAASLPNTVTSFCRIWDFTRLDGTVFRYAQHDVDVISTNPAGTYKAKQSADITAIANVAALQVPEVTLSGIVNTGDIEIDEVQTGLFDYAKIVIYLIDWKTPSNGTVILRAGRFGEWTLNSEGSYTAEIRDLSQNYAQRFIEHTQPDCRADLGDSRCQIPIEPSGGNWLAIDTLIETLNGTYPNALINPSFAVPGEAGTDISTLTGWTIVSGGWTQVVTVDEGLTAYHSGYYLKGGTSSGEVRQDVVLFDSYGIQDAAIDAGDIDWAISVRRANSDVDDTGQIIVEALDAVSSLVSTLWTGPVEAISPLDTWTEKTSSGTLPATTRIVRVRLLHNLVTGTDGDTCFDHVDLTFTDTNPGAFPNADATGTYIDNLVKNNSFELDAAGVDVSSVSNWEIVSGKWNIRTSSGSMTAPDTGAQFLQGGTAASAEIRQDVDLSEAQISTTDIDAGNVSAALTIQRGNSDVDDTGQVIVEYLDSAKVLIATAYTSADEAFTPGFWNQRSYGGYPSTISTLNVGTRYIRIRLLCTLVTGADIEACFDTVALAIKLPDTPSGQQIYENRIYAVTNTTNAAGFTDAKLDTTIDATSWDGGLLLTATEAWTRHGWVNTVIDSKNFTIWVDEERADSDAEWFAYGAITFEEGSITFRPFRVKSWDKDTRQVEMFLDLPFTPYLGQKIKIYPGCQKRPVEDCETKFDNVINIQSEPDAPTEDFVKQFPEDV